MTVLPHFRASKPGNLISVAPCKAFGMRVQVEFKGKKQTLWALTEIHKTDLAIALIDHEGKTVAQSTTWR